MKKLNNKGFAISTVIYGLSVMGIMIVAILLATMAQSRSNTRQLSKTVEDELNKTVLDRRLKKVEYITGDGSHYIDTGYKPMPSTGIYIDFQLDDPSVLQQRIFSVNDTESLYYEMYVNGSGNLAYAYKDNEGNWINTGIEANSERTTIEFNKSNDKKLKINDTTLDISGTPTVTSKITMKIFTHGKIGYKVKGKLYSFKIYEDGTIKHDFIPVKREYDGLEGLYDSKDNKFHTLNNTIEVINTELID